jgi:hypothetical protein
MGVDPATIRVFTQGGVMVLTDAPALTGAEQLRLSQGLAAALPRDEASPLIETGREYPVWSPDAVFGAADVLLRSLGDGREQS